MKTIVLFVCLITQVCAVAQLRLIKNLDNSSNSSTPHFLTKFKNQIYFLSKDENNVYSLWKTGGLNVNTELVYRLNIPDFRSFHQNLIATNKYLYFVNYSANTGYDVWRTDGTESGTQLLADIDSGDYYHPSSLLAIQDTLFFIAYSKSKQFQIWRTDGSKAGTQPVTNFTNITYYHRPVKLINHNDQLYFTYNTNQTIATQLYKLGNSNSGAILIKEFTEWDYYEPDNFTTVGNLLYFTISQPQHGKELWVTDGSPQNTRIVIDLFPGSISSYPANLVALRGKLYFIAKLNSGFEIYSTDGSAIGTEMLIMPVTGTPNIKELYVINNLLYFQANDQQFGTEAWISNGQADSTFLIADLNPGFVNSAPSNFCDCGDRIYFFTFVDNSVSNLWMLKNGKVKFVQMIPRIAASFIRHFGCYENEFYISTKTQNSGIELFRTWDYNANNIDLEVNNFIYPNPTQDQFSIAPIAFSYGLEFTDLIIYNLLGQEVIHLNSHEINEKPVDVSSLSNGIYTVILQSKSGVKFTQKISIL